MNCIQYSITIVLVYYHCGSFLELVCVYFRPPVLQISIGSILATLIIKTMCHFMTDHSSNATIVYCIVSTKVKEGELQNAGRENNLVIGRVVIGIYGRRGHAPAGLIYRLTISADHIIVHPLAYPACIAQVII